MKRINGITLAILAPLILLLFVAAAPQVSTVTSSTVRFSDGYRITTITWVADSTGAVTATNTPYLRGIVSRFVTIPDTSLVPAVEDSSGRAPTDNYDITLTSTLLTSPAGGIEWAGNALTDRDHSQIEEALPRHIDTRVSGDQDTLSVSKFINEPLLFDVTGNTTPNATGRLLIYWQDK